MSIFTEAPASGQPETVSSTRVDWAPVPKVNLLPPEIQQARRLARLKRVLAGAVAVVVLVCVGSTVWAQAGASAAQDELDAAQSRGVALRAEQERYSAVPKVLDLIQAAGGARERAMSQDVLWYGFMSDLSLVTPKGITLTSMQVDLDKPTADTDPLVSTGLATVSFTGTAQSLPEVADWLDAVAHVDGVASATLQNVTRDDNSGAKTGALNFTASAQVTSKALTHRYDRKAD